MNTGNMFEFDGCGKIKEATGVERKHNITRVKTGDKTNE